MHWPIRFFPRDNKDCKDGWLYWQGPDVPLEWWCTFMEDTMGAFAVDGKRWYVWGN